MAEAIQDQNTVKSKLGVLFSDGVTLVPIVIDSSSNSMKINIVDTVPAGILALYAAGKSIPRDSNNQPAWCGQSNTNANVLYPFFVDADGAVLIDM